MFNGIVYEFLILKCQLYKKLIKNGKELQKMADDIIKSKENNISIKKIYLKELNIYYSYAREYLNDNLDKLYEGI